MNPSAEFFKAELPPAKIIMRMRMAPYSLGHQILLRATGNAFVDDEAEPQYADLVCGVLICCQPYHRSRLALESRWLRLFLRYWGWRCGNFDIPQAMIQFRDYIREGQWHPDVNSTGERGQVLTSPWEHRLKVWLMERMHMSVGEALDYPLASAQLDYIVSGEMNGSIEPFSERNAEMFRLAKSMGEEKETAE